MPNKVHDLRFSLIVDREHDYEVHAKGPHKEVLRCHISLHVAIHVVTYNRIGIIVTVIDADDADWKSSQKFDFHVDCAQEETRKYYEMDAILHWLQIS